MIHLPAPLSPLPIPLPCFKFQSCLFSAICERSSRLSSLFFRTLGSDGLENKGVTNPLKPQWWDFKGSGRGFMDSRIQGASPGAKARPLFCGICGPAEAVPLLQSSSTKARLLFCATCGPRPTHWVGSPVVPFYRALLLRVFRQVLRGIQGGWAGITLLWNLEVEIRIEWGGQILRKRVPAQVI